MIIGYTIPAHVWVCICVFWRTRELLEAWDFIERRVILLFFVLAAAKVEGGERRRGDVDFICIKLCKYSVQKKTNSTRDSARGLWSIASVAQAAHRFDLRARNVCCVALLAC